MCEGEGEGGGRGGDGRIYVVHSVPPFSLFAILGPAAKGGRQARSWPRVERVSIFGGGGG